MGDTTSLSTGHSLIVSVSLWVKKIAKASTLFKMDKQKSLSVLNQLKSIWWLEAESPD